jgi:hypothetical protein
MRKMRRVNHLRQHANHGFFVDSTTAMGMFPKIKGAVCACKDDKIF